MYINKCQAGELCCAKGKSFQQHTKAEREKCSKIKLQLMKAGKLEPMHKTEQRVYIPTPKNISNQTMRVYARK